MARIQKRPGDQRALTGAASQLPLKNPEGLRKRFRKTDDWQVEAWEFFDTVPELKFAANWAGNLMAKVKLYPAVLNSDGEPIACTDETSGVPADTANQLVMLMDQLAGTFGGQADIQRELTVNLDVAGECYLIGWGAHTDPVDPLVQIPETWEIRSVSEVTVKGSGEQRVVNVKGSPADKDGKQLNPDLDVAVRCWVRHPRWSDLPDTNVKALTTELRSLQVLSAQVMAESMSRANAGLLLMPNEFTFGSAEGSDQDSPDDGDNEQDDPFVRDLTEAVTRPIQDPGDPSSVVPLVVRAPNEYLPNVRLVSLSRETSVELDKRIEERVLRVSRGLNVPVEVVRGHANTTFSNAQQISEDEFTDHLEPRALLQCDLLTVGYLRPKAAALGIDASRVFIWYDASALKDPPDQSAAADAAYDRQAISPAAYRAAKGFTEEDAPTVTEQIQQVALKRGIVDAPTTAAILATLDPTFTPPAPPPPPAIAAPAAPADQAQAQAMAILAALSQRSQQAVVLASMLGMELPGLGPVIDTDEGPAPGNPSVPRG